MTREKAFSTHDHDSCVEAALDRAALVCAQRGARLTELRRRVLALVWRGHAPVGAYEIMAQMGSAAPPTVYRALDFLMEQGLVHRIESLNAYVGCERPQAAHASQFLICSSCGAAAEIDDAALAAAVEKRAARLGFLVDRQMVELRGRCPRCHETGVP